MPKPEEGQARDTRSQTKVPPVYYFGTPVVLITTLNADGTANVSPMSSAWALGDRIVLGMAGTSHGRSNLNRERQAVLNFPDGALWSNVEAIARATGRNPVPPHKAKIGYQYVADKVGLSGLTAVPSIKVRPPRLAECPLQIEVELMAAHEPAFWPAGRPEAFQILETRVVACHAHAGIVRADGTHIDTDRWKPLMYVFRSYMEGGATLGANFKSAL